MSNVFFRSCLVFKLITYKILTRNVIIVCNHRHKFSCKTPNTDIFFVCSRIPDNKSLIFNIKFKGILIIIKFNFCNPQRRKHLLGFINRYIFRRLKSCRLNYPLKNLPRVIRNRLVRSSDTHINSNRLLTLNRLF